MTVWDKLLSTNQSQQGSSSASQWESSNGSTLTTQEESDGEVNKELGPLWCCCREEEDGTVFLCGSVLTVGAMLPPSCLELFSSSSLSRVNTGAVALLLLVLCLLHLHRKPREFANIPPGPKPWPVVGNFGGFLVPSVLRRKWTRSGSGAAAAPVRNAAVILTEQANVYGPVFSMFAGKQLIVVLNGYEAVREALLKHPEEFSDRPDIPSVSIMTKRKGDDTGGTRGIYLYLFIMHMVIRHKRENTTRWKTNEVGIKSTMEIKKN